jgi:hypothetical protein
MSFSEVPRIELNQDGTVTFYVNVGGFKVGTPVEISGYATQSNGAVATFRDVQPMRPGDPVKGVIMVVRCVPVIGSKFTEKDPITVIARAADVWISKLHTGEKELSEEIREARAQAGQANIRTAWNSDEKTYHSVYSAASSYEESPTATPLLHHGTWWDGVKREPLPGVMEGRFTRLFPDLPGARFKHDDLVDLARVMIAPDESGQPEDPGQEAEVDPEENPGIPAAYTYLGQFVDHDLTFDPISQLRKGRTPVQLRALVDFRTPRFDLDNLYGRGPDDQPYMYDDDGICLLPGKQMPGNPFDPGAVQLPRGPNGRALIGDPRDDENRIIAQLHAIFLRFHNKVVRELGGKKHVSFEEVRQQVRWHYQWVLVKDFLPKILDEETYNSVFPDPYSPVPTIPKLRENDLELMPVEFSVAAYRFGHSMVRPQYRLNPAIEHPIPIFSSDRSDTADLGGFRPIPANWAIDWHYFIDLDHSAEPPGELQLSYKIDTSLVHPLGNLPPQIAKDPSSLALRNLERGWIFQLPSGQRVAEALGLPVIADEDLVIRKAIVDTPKWPIAEIASRFAGNAPLWAYVLSEAQVMSWKNVSPQNDIPIRLGPVGGRLVAEVFASLLRGDPTSYVNTEHKFKPFPEFSHGRTFGLAELINVALGRKP